MTAETHCKVLELKSSLDEEVIRDQKAEIERLQAIVDKWTTQDRFRSRRIISAHEMNPP